MTSVAHDPAVKTCARCSATKPVQDFGKHSRQRDGLQSSCRACVRQLSLESAAIRNGAAVRTVPAEATCASCRLVKPVEDFPRRGPSGRRGTCKPCWNKAGRALYAKSGSVRASRAATRKAWRADNAEAYRETSLLYYQTHKDEARVRNAQWRAKNPGLANARLAKRRAIQREATVAQFSTRDLAARMAYFGHQCWMCRGPFEHVDHVKPLSKGGAHALANLRPSCADCNRRKAGRWYGPQELHRFIKN